MEASMLNIFQSFGNHLYVTLVEKDRYLLILRGLGNTLLMSFFAILIGTVIGVVVATVKYFTQSTGKLKWLEWICNLYTTVIRGTPVMVQLLIWATVILISVREALPIAIIGFGVNSGAYVSEIIRAGINSIDAGQTEAGRSLGLNRLTTMRLIVLPQAVKNILPALANEFIALIKETSIAGYIAVHDLTKAGEIIKGNTYDGTALFVVAGIYLVLVFGLTQLLGIAERRLRQGDKR